MKPDKPGGAVIRLLNDLADVRTALRLAGFGEASIERICSKYVEARLTPARRDPPRDSPEMGWRDGRWTRTEPETELNPKPI